MDFSRSSVTTGALLTFAMRGADRFIGLLSILILARLLAPDDFGIIAMATLVVALADVLLDLGVNVALIRNREVTQADYDTAWTLRLVQTGLSTAILILAAPWAAEYFQDPRVTPVLQILAFTLLLSGLENIGVVAFHRNMQFGAEFRFLFARRLGGFIVTLVAAWFLRSYWALVIGTLAGRTLGVVLSYAMHPMRPRLGLSRFREIFAVSQWMLLRGIGEFLHNNLHRILVGRWTPASTMGAYAVANEISTMPSSELLAPMNRALFPALAEARDNPAELRRLLLLAQGVQAMLALPAVVGLALVAEPAVLVLLGEKWREVVPLLQILALAGIGHALTATGGYTLLVLGKMAQATLILWVQVIVFAVLALLVLRGGTAVEVASLRLGVIAAGTGFSIWILTRSVSGLTVSAILHAIRRPALATAVMVAGVLAVGSIVQAPPATTLVVEIATGLMIYPAVVLLTWQKSGRPDGAENWLLRKLQTAFRRS